jgi:small-conductance mechanosensitive channel
MANETTAADHVAEATATAAPPVSPTAATPKSIFDSLADFWQGIDVQVINLMLPHQLRQVAVLVGLFALSWLSTRWLAPWLYNRMRELEGLPKWQLRALVIMHRRLNLITFALYAWLSVGVVMMITVFPSRRNILELAATIATAWLFLAIAARVVQNRFLRKLVTWSLWIYATLFYLDMLDQAAKLLDDLALETGDLRISILSILKVLVITGVLFTLARFIAKNSSARVQRNEDISPSMKVLMIKLFQMVLYGAAFFIGLKAVGVDLTGLAFLSGAIGLGLGFGLQKVVSNLVSGVIILMDKSIKPGDVISLGDTFGWINSLGARYASVEMRDGREYLIPNEDLITGQVVNWSHTDDFVRLEIRFGTAYRDDPHLVRKVAIQAALSVDRVLVSRAPVCHIVGFGDSSVDYTLRFWIDDPTAGLTNIRGNVFLALWDAFKENSITIPFPQREVKLLPEEEEKADA